MMIAPNGDCFHNYRNKRLPAKSILRFGAARFVFIFVLSSTLAALFAFFPA